MNSLYPEHRKELEASAIAPEIAAARGYRTVGRPTANDDAPRQELKRLGIPKWAIDEDRLFPGLLIPLYRATGERVSAQWKPRAAVRNSAGKLMKYASVKGRASVLDVHPINRDRIVDPTVSLWVTEGVKKADSLASWGLCVVALSGVFNWRSNMGTLGDWEDIPLRGREVVICFDADARSNPLVLKAMVRFGRWLKSKGAGRIFYLIVPSAVGTTEVKGTDDFLAAGGTIDQLLDAATTSEPRIESTGDAFTDARLAETIADDVLEDAFCWALGLSWMQWDGQRWKRCSDTAIGEAVRQYSLERFAAAAAALTRGEGSAEALDGWRSMLSAGRERSVTSLAKGIVERRQEEFDCHLDLLNTPNGVVNLETGELLPHDPTLLMTKVAGAEYRPGATHPDWEQALQALPPDVQDYMQIRLGQAITGHMTPDDALVIGHGGGENGKTTLNDTLSRAVGDYFLLVSDRALMANPDAHPTELMDFKGARYAVLEETPEARRLDPQRLKRTVGTPRITARRIRQDSVTFDATHSLFINTNHRPNVEESDHGTWRRLLLVTYPYRFRKPHEPLESPNDRHGDPALRDRCKTDPAIWAAALAWLVEGAKQWYAAGKVMPPPPEPVVRDTRQWRTDSDLILGYWDDRLVADPASHVISAELMADFNSWLESKGHRAWADKTFVARFGGHDELAIHRVARQNIRAKPGLSRPTYTGFNSGYRAPLSAPPERYRAWLGIRFATAADVDIDEDEKPALISENAAPGTGGTRQGVNPKMARMEALTLPRVPPVPNSLQASTNGTAVAVAEPPDPFHCAPCARTLPALVWLPCDRCGEPTHARGRGAHGPTCHACLTERKAS